VWRSVSAATRGASDGGDHTSRFFQIIGEIIADASATSTLATSLVNIDQTAPS
jgi:hypothetical protein